MHTHTLTRRRAGEKHAEPESVRYTGRPVVGCLEAADGTRVFVWRYLDGTKRKATLFVSRGNALPDALDVPRLNMSWPAVWEEPEHEESLPEGDAQQALDRFFAPGETSVAESGGQPGQDAPGEDTPLQPPLAGEARLFLTEDGARLLDPPCPIFWPGGADCFFRHPEDDQALAQWLRLRPPEVREAFLAWERTACAAHLRTAVPPPGMPSAPPQASRRRHRKLSRGKRPCDKVQRKSDDALFKAWEEKKRWSPQRATFNDLAQDKGLDEGEVRRVINRVLKRSRALAIARGQRA